MVELILIEQPQPADAKPSAGEGEVFLLGDSNDVNRIIEPWDLTDNNYRAFLSGGEEVELIESEGVCPHKIGPLRWTTRTQIVRADNEVLGDASNYVADSIRHRLRAFYGHDEKELRDVSLAVLIEMALAVTADLYDRATPTISSI